MRLSELEALPSFALLGPGFSGTEEWTLVAPLGEEGPAAVTVAPYEVRGRDAPVFRGPARRVSPEIDVAPAALEPELDETGHGEAVAAIRAAIAAGDVYQVNHTLRARFECPRAAALLATLLRRGTPRFAAWLRLPDGGEIVSASPERFFSVEGRRILVEPMKGTAPPHRMAELEASEKDRAELAMIADLLRNDLARLCVPRSVRVLAERRLLRLPYAIQAVAEIEGLLPEGVGIPEVLDALHPGGSITGAPKEAACAWIAALETAPRGIYCGALGLAEGDRAEFSIAIRTAFRTAPGPWTYGVGGGIVWDSSAENELHEARLKLGALR